MTNSQYNIAHTNVDSEMFSYEYFQQVDVCRLCWIRDASIDLFSGRDESLLEEQIVQKVQYCLGIDLRLGAESLPCKVCVTCSGHIETFYMFKCFCVESDQTMKEIFEKHSSEPTTVFSTDVKIESLTDIPEGDIFEDTDQVSNSLATPLQSETEITGSTNSCEQKPIGPEVSNDIIQNISPPKNNKHIKEKVMSSNNHNIRPKRKLAQRYATISRKKKRTQADTSNNDMNKQIEKIKAKPVDHKQNESKIMIEYPPNTLPEFCIECKIIFKDVHKLSIHNKNVHGKDDGDNFKCYGCEKMFPSKKNRIRHETVYCHGLKDGYKCFLCDRFLPYRQILQRHLKEHESVQVDKVPYNIFKCKECGKSFKTRQRLVDHKSTHVHEYVCETCGRVFTRVDYLNIHKLIHTGVKRHRCPHCSYRATQRSSLVVHLRIHTGERPFQCDMCPLRCVSKSSLSAHLRRHLGHIRYKCQICPKTFGYKESLKTHIMNFHECPVSYTCQYCKFSYRRKTSLNRHLRTKHQNEK